MHVAKINWLKTFLFSFFYCFSLFIFPSQLLFPFMLMCVCVRACLCCVCGKQQYVILLVRHKKSDVFAKNDGRKIWRHTGGRCSLGASVDCLAWSSSDLSARQLRKKELKTEHAHRTSLAGFFARRSVLCFFLSNPPSDSGVYGVYGSTSLGVYGTFLWRMRIRGEPGCSRLLLRWWLLVFIVREKLILQFSSNVIITFFFQNESWN